VRILLSDLRAAGACADQVALFEARFGDGVDVTEALCLSVADLFDWSWAADYLLPAPARAEYWRAVRDLSMSLAWDERRRVLRDLSTWGTVWAEYQRAKAVTFARTAGEVRP